MNNIRVATCAERLKKALSTRGMSQAELCKLTQTPKSAVSQYLSGKYEPKQDRIYAFSKVLNVSEAWLMGLDVPMERQKTQSKDNQSLTEGERVMLDLFRKVPKDQQQLVLQMIRVALSTKE